MVWRELILCIVSLACFVHADIRTISCSVAGSCVEGWVPTAGDSVVVQGSLQDEQLPVVRLNSSYRSSSASSEWQLNISRMVLLDVQLNPPPSSSAKQPVQPLLWPMNAFSGFGNGLTLQDVRMAISTAAFTQHLVFFRSQPTLQGTINPNLHTDGRTFIHITNWNYGSTILHSVTLLSGPCSSQFNKAQGQDLTSALAWDTSTPGSNSSTGVVLGSRGDRGCNVVTAANSTLVSVLLEAGKVSSTEQLLVLLQGNTSLGHQVSQPIRLGRPVALAGLWSVPTGIDFEMKVNHLDITKPEARTAFNTLVLENLGTGDIKTLSVTGPFTPVATIQVYALYCNRGLSDKVCTVLMNVTLVVPSKEQMGFIGPLVPSGNSNQTTEPIIMTSIFFKLVKFVPGPTPGSILIINATALSWQLVDVLVTLQPLVFEPLALPVRSYVDGEDGFKTPVVLLVQNCADLKAGLVYRTQPQRLHVLLMRKSFSLKPSITSQVASIPVSPMEASTTTYGFVDPRNWNITDWPRPVPLPTCLGDRPFAPYRMRLQGQLTDDLETVAVPEIDPRSGAVAGGLATLGLTYTRNAIYAPSRAQSQFQVTFQSMVLSELPQGASLADLEATAQLPMALPPEAWTVLLWAVGSATRQRTLRVQQSVLKLPEPEYEHLAALGRASTSFEVELAGPAAELAFGNVVVHANHFTAASFSGPGVKGENVTFMVDPGAQQALRALGTPYWWPASYQPVPLSGSTHQPRDVQLLPAILVPLIAALLLAAGVFVWLVHRRRCQQQPGDEKPLQQPSPSASGMQADAAAAGGDTRSNHGSSGTVSGEVAVALDKLSGRGTGSNTSGAGQQRPDAAAAAPSPYAPPAYVSEVVAASGSGSGGSLNTASRQQVSLTQQFLDRRSKQQQQPAGNAPRPGRSPAPDQSTAASNSTLASAVLLGLQQWRSAISSTTMQLAERRLAGQAAAAMSLAGLQAGVLAGASSVLDAAAAADGDLCSRAEQGPSSNISNALLPRQQQPPAAAAAAAGPSPGSTDSRAAAGSSALVLKQMLGTGNFGQVWQGVWRGTPVAVKILHLPANAFSPPDQQQAAQSQSQQQQRPVSPHVAVMEAVLSSQCGHPNVVQMYTYMLTPVLTAANGTNRDPQEASIPTIVGEPGHNSCASDVAAAAAAAAAALTAGGGAVLSAWELRLVMELCDGGTLRAALDKGVYNQPGAYFMEPDLVTLLARDVAAAMLHLHSENVVHGDLKAGNVLLTTGGADSDGLWQRWAGSPQRIIAKVADLGLSLVLAPEETHASLAARGTPSHMPAEAWSGRMSKAGDSYAFGMLLYEAITGLRPFSGLPLPMLAHEVAVKRLRPEWPPSLPAGFKGLQQLAEACWQHAPEDRPTFAQVFDVLDQWVSGRVAYLPSWLSRQQLSRRNPQPSALPLLPLDELGLLRASADKEEASQAQQQQESARRRQEQQHQEQGRQHSAVRSGAGTPAGFGTMRGAQGLTHSRGVAHMEWSEVRYDVAPLHDKADTTPPSSQTGA